VYTSHCSDELRLRVTYLTNGNVDTKFSAHDAFME